MISLIWLLFVFVTSASQLIDWELGRLGFYTSQVLGWEDHLWNDLWCVVWDCEIILYLSVYLFPLSLPLQSPVFSSHSPFLQKHKIFRCFSDPRLLYMSFSALLMRQKCAVNSAVYFVAFFLKFGPTIVCCRCCPGKKVPPASQAHVFILVKWLLYYRPETATEPSMCPRVQHSLRGLN